MANRSSWMKKLSPALQSHNYGKPNESHHNEPHHNEHHRVMIEFSGKRSEKIIINTINNYNGVVYQKMKLIPLIGAKIPFLSIQKLAQQKKVKKIWQDSQVHAQLGAAKQLGAATSERRGLAIRDSGYTGKNVTIAVLDTGIHPHPDLILPENRIVAWMDFVNRKPLPYDDNGHGTHIAGIIAGNGISCNKKFRGMAPDAGLVGVKVLDKSGKGNLSDIISGIEWCIQNRSTYNIKIINLSAGLTIRDLYHSHSLSRLMDIAFKKGIIICTAAGMVNLPGREVFKHSNSGVITVGNRDDLDIRRSDWNSTKTRYYKDRVFNEYAGPDLLVPGTGIISLRVGGGYRPLTGASVSTALISGIIAQLLEKQPRLRPAQIKKILRRKAAFLNGDMVLQGHEALNADAIFWDSYKHKHDRPEKQTIDALKQNYILLRSRFNAYLPNPYLLFLILILLILSFSPGCQ